MLKQAREACVAKRDENNKLKRRISTLPTEVTKPKSAKITTDQQKMCKIQFQDYESDSENDEFDDVISEKNCSRSLPIASSSHTLVEINAKNPRFSIWQLSCFPMCLFENILPIT